MILSAVESLQFQQGSHRPQQAAQVLLVANILKQLLLQLSCPSVNTSKAAINDHFKTGQR